MAHKEDTTPGATEPSKQGLRVKTATIQQILHDNTKAVTRTLKILQTWRNTCDKRGDVSAMYNELCATLSDLDRTDMVDDIRREQSRFARDVARTKKQQAVPADEGGTGKQTEDKIKALRSELRSCRGNGNQKDEEIKTLTIELANCQKKAKDAYEKNRMQKDEIKRLKRELQSLRPTNNDQLSCTLNENGMLCNIGQNHVLADYAAVESMAKVVKSATKLRYL
ncbi:hypothetical protein LSAT2_011911 [Lamellibrachia satsuma]|nr:hypothetical protein LSAT2_011911 [Lamellibrachia satsuma]